MTAVEYKKPPHYELSAAEIDVGPLAEQWKIDVIMVHDTASPGNRPRFLFKATYTKGSQSIESHYQTFICGIPGNAKVNIRIDPTIASWCRWSRVFLPVTAKSENEPDIGSFSHANGIATFKVKKRNENDLRYHHLYLNVELLIGRTTEGRTIWADYNYDPDVINPRPPGRVMGVDETLIQPYIELDEDGNEIAHEVIVPPPPPITQAKPQIAIIAA